MNVTLLGPTSRFITRYVFVLYRDYNEAWRAEHEMDRGPSRAVETDDDGS